MVNMARHLILLILVNQDAFARCDAPSPLWTKKEIHMVGLLSVVQPLRQEKHREN